MFQLQGHQRAQNADKSHDSRQQLQRPGDAESAFEYLKHPGPQFAIGLRVQVCAHQGFSLKLVDDGLNISIAGDKQRGRGNERIVIKLAVHVIIHHDGTLIGGIIVIHAHDGEGLHARIRQQSELIVLRRDSPAEGERLAHDNLPGPQRLPEIRHIQPGEASVTGRNLTRTRVQIHRRQVRVIWRGHFHRTHKFQTLHTRQRGQFVQDSRVNIDSRTVGGQQRRRNINICAECGVQPVRNRVTEAPDHHADTHNHAHGDGQRGHSDGRAADGACHRARGHTPQNAKNPVCQRGRQAHEHQQHSRCKQCPAEYDGKQRGKRHENILCGDLQKPITESIQRQRGDGQQRDQAQCTLFDIRAAQCPGRRGTCGVNRRNQRGGDAGEQADQRAFDQCGWRYGDALHVYGVVQVAYGLRHQPHRAAPEQDAQAEAEDRTHQPKQEGFAQDQRENLAASRAERPQCADHRPALHHAERHRVVNQEHTYRQRQQTERL